MMGIVERLRDRLTFKAAYQATHLHSLDWNKGDLWLNEAAAEIERLRSELSTAQSDFDARIRSAVERKAEPPTNVEGSPLLEWAVEQWKAQVKHRPLVNVHRRSLDDVWRQVIRWAGGDPVSLVGPSHDELLAAAGENS